MPSSFLSCIAPGFLDSLTPAASSALGQHNLPSLNMDLWLSLGAGQRHDPGL